MTARRWDLRGTAYLVINILCWALVPVFLRDLANPAHGVDPWVANGLRYPMAAVLYWPALILACRSGTLTRSLLVRSIPAAAFSFGGQILWAQAPYYMDAGTIGFLVQFAVIWGVLGAMIMFPEERPLLRAPAFYIGIILAVAGFGTMSISRGALDGEASTTGVLILLVCSLLFAGYGLCVRKYLRHDAPILAFAVVAQYVTVGCVALMFLKGDVGAIPSISLKGWFLLAASSFLGIGLAHVLLYAAIQRLGPSISSVGRLVIPFITLLIAYFVLDERLTLVEWMAGFAMVGGGVAVVSTQNRLQPVEPVKP